MNYIKFGKLVDKSIKDYNLKPYGLDGIEDETSRQYFQARNLLLDRLEENIELKKNNRRLKKENKVLSGKCELAKNTLDDIAKDLILNENEIIEEVEKRR